MGGKDWAIRHWDIGDGANNIGKFALAGGDGGGDGGGIIIIIIRIWAQHWFITHIGDLVKWVWD